MELSDYTITASQQDGGRWQVSIDGPGMARSVGSFDTKDDALVRAWREIKEAREETMDGDELLRRVGRITGTRHI